jgi:uncharacterized protein (TIGR02996 family)
MFHPVTRPPLPGRVAAVSETAGERFAVWTDAGVHVLKLKLNWTRKSADSAVLWETVPLDRAAERLDPATGLFRWRTLRYKMHGACGPGGGVVGQPLPTERKLGQTVERNGDRLFVRDTAGVVRQTIDRCGAKAAWAVAGFCGYNGEFLLVAHPGSVRLFRFAGSAEGGGAEWQRAGSAGDQHALVRAITDNSDDDTPRLVYADWLEEHGDPARAEFIRLACRIAEREEVADVPFGDPDEERDRQLRDANAERWGTELPAAPGVHYQFPGLRGFPTVGFQNPDDQCKHGDRILAATPVEAVHFHRAPRLPLGRWMKSEFPERTARLTAWWLPDGAEAGLCDWLVSPRAARLRRLVLGNCSVAAWTAILQAVAASRHLGRLEKLDVAEYQPGPPPVEVVLAVARSPHLPRLRDVDSGYWFQYPDGAKRELRQRFPGIDLK